ncbi:hypothetical protein TNCV_5141771 [Trichonephila clavipes]|nr:hypothetical protein TNCV_5141771 [Trichonephila clavipes]
MGVVLVLEQLSRILTPLLYFAAQQPFAGETIAQFSDLPNFYYTAYRRSLPSIVAVLVIFRTVSLNPLVYATAPAKPYVGSLNIPVTSTLGIHSLVFLSHKRRLSFSYKCNMVNMCEGTKEWTAVKTDVSLPKIAVKKTHLVNLFVSGCRKTLNSSRVGSTSVSPQGYTIEKRGDKLPMIEVTRQHSQ